MTRQSKLKQVREYRIWTNMKTRCFNPRCVQFPRYGGRGITVCARWRHDFQIFLSDMGRCPDGLTIERKNNDGNYEPSNCVWAGLVEQMNNRTSIRKFAYQGRYLSIAQWAREVGIPEGTVRNRLNRGEPIERAIDTRLWHLKLTPAQVQEARLRLAAGEKGVGIAASFGVDQSTISAIKSGKNWRGVPADPRIECVLEELR